MTETRTYIDENGNTVIEEYEKEPEIDSTTIVIDGMDSDTAPSDEDEDSEEESEQEEQPPVYNIETEGIPAWAYPDTSKQCVRLVDGTIVKGRASTDFSEDNLWIWIDADSSLDFMTAAILFMDITKTSTITFVDMNGQEKAYTGYSRMAGINVEKNGGYTICMKKP